MFALDFCWIINGNLRFIFEYLKHVWRALRNFWLFFNKTLSCFATFERLISFTICMLQYCIYVYPFKGNSINLNILLKVSFNILKELHFIMKRFFSISLICIFTIAFRLLTNKKCISTTYVYCMNIPKSIENIRCIAD